MQCQQMVTIDSCCEPEQCPEPATIYHAVSEAAMCAEHASNAERYAVASIVYYSNTGIDTGLSDAQYDGFCDFLLQRQAWKRIPWIERDMLLCGSGFDTKKFPSRLHARAQAQMGEALL